MCRPVIVGDDKGQLLEVVLDEKEKRDPPVKALYSFEDAPARVTGIDCGNLEVIQLRMQCCAFRPTCNCWQTLLTLCAEGVLMLHLTFQVLYSTACLEAQCVLQLTFRTSYMHQSPARLSKAVF